MKAVSPREWSWKHALAALAVVLCVSMVAVAGDRLDVYQHAKDAVTKDQLRTTEEATTYRRGTLRLCQRIASRYGLRISSTWRSVSHNRRVGGVPNSSHLRGSLANPGACDFSGSTRAYQRAAAYARRRGAIEVLIHNVGSGLHLHLSWF